MSFQDKSIQCSDCGTTFAFSAGEQEQFASRGYNNEPKRCSWCRAIWKMKHYGDGGYSYRPIRQMFPATCAECGKDTAVPFEPRSGRPVYCSDCYRKVKVTR